MDAHPNDRASWGSASAAADCPACGSRYGRSSSYNSSYGSNLPRSYSSSVGSGGGQSSVGGSGSSVRPRWSRAGSSAVYTDAQVRALTPVRTSIENGASLPDRRDVFLCHARDDRAGAAKELHELLVPIVHDTTYEALRDVSPLLGSRSGLCTREESMSDVAGKLAELVTL
ncbi:MAG: hypothetical protein ABI120_09025 [Gemmatimonadaceae bacterium]